jgi:hypothetical protein
MMNNDEKNQFRRAIKAAINANEYTSVMQVGKAAAIGETTLYPFMKGRGSLSEVSADKLRPLLARWLTNSEANGRTKTNGHTKSNGHNRPSGKAAKSSNGHKYEPVAANNAGRLGLTHAVLDKLAQLRESTQDQELASRIDEMVARWGTEGLELFAEAAIGVARGN